MSFPPIYYINLDKRHDRKEHFERQIALLGINTLNVTRVSGVDKPGFGPLGCGLSHCKALEAFIESAALAAPTAKEFVDPEALAKADDPIPIEFIVL